MARRPYQRRKKFDSGIYLIRNRASGAYYLGRAQSTSTRLSHHRSALRNRRHKNAHLQTAWDKYGEDAFEFVTLYFCPMQDLVAEEQRWLNMIVGRSECYNLHEQAVGGLSNVPEVREKHRRNVQDVARRKREDPALRARMAEYARRTAKTPEWRRAILEGIQRRQSNPEWRTSIKALASRNKADPTWPDKIALGQRRHRGMNLPSFISPEGVAYHDVPNVTRFALQQRLSRGFLGQLLAGKLDQYRGWRIWPIRTPLRRRNGKPLPSLRAPDGTTYNNIFDLPKFCGEYGLQEPSISLVLSGKASHHHGWTDANRPATDPIGLDRVLARNPTRAFQSPDGTVHAGIRALKRFCLEHGLHHGSMAKVWRGESTRHKGWVRYPPDELALLPFGARLSRAHRKGRPAPSFVSPDGTIHEGVENISGFARDRGLDYGCLCSVARGQQRHHKGWRLLPSASAAIAVK